MMNTDMANREFVDWLHMDLYSWRYMARQKCC